MALGRGQVLQRADRETSAADVRLEGPGVPRRVGQHKAVPGPDPPVEVLEARDDAGDVVPDHVVVRGHGLPVHRVVLAEGGVCHPGDDHRLREQVVRNRVEPALGGVDHGHGVLHGQELGAARVLVVLVRPAQRGQDERGPPVHHVGPVRLGGHMHGQADALHPGFQGFGVGAGQREVAAHGHKDVHVVAFEGLHRFHGVVAVAAR
ncbi:hypothetical protein D9M72_507910 [compost metagenome]